MKRRHLIQASAAAISTAAIGGTALAAAHKGRWRGVIGYFADAGTRTGSEYFSVTRHAGGDATLRAVCEMDDDALVRDTVLTLGPGDLPKQAYLKTTQYGETVGTAWYRFNGQRVYADIQSGNANSVRQAKRFETPPRFFGTHSLVNDAWLARLIGPGETRLEMTDLLSTSLAANGSGVPGLYQTQATISLVGEDSVDVAAGRFDCQHYRVAYGDYPPLDMWVTGPERLLALMSWAHLAGRYELLTLEHEAP